MEIRIDSPSDQAILSALREGKLRQAAGLLVRYHGNTIYNVCRTLVTDPELAEDLTQESFRRAFAGLSGIQGSASPRSWLVGIAQSCCAEALQAVSSPEAAELPEIEPAGLDSGVWRISESLQRRLEVLAAAL